MILVTTNTSVSVHVNVVEDGGATVRDFGMMSCIRPKCELAN